MDDRTAGRRPRIAVLWEAFSGYFGVTLQALADEGADLLVFRRNVMGAAPFDADAITAGLETHAWTGGPDQRELDEALEAFQPDAIIVISWHIGPYRKAAKNWRGRTLRILAISNPWEATLKQFGGIAVAPWVIKPTYDAALLCDERQAVFATKLGIPAERFIWGMNTCDHPSFSAIAAARGDELPPKAFLFVGRLVPVKAIDVMADGYRKYRDEVDDPWPLLIAGRGPQADLLEGVEGVEMVDFVQPADLPELFGRAGCLVLPSLYEPWGVVIHEATAAGLPVICSRACGASTRLVLDGYNGVVVTPGDTPAFTRALRRIHRADDAERRAMSQASASLSLQYTPKRWAENLLRRIPDLREDLGLSPAPWVGEAALVDVE
jgi:glycosyltransferase involved in cell wall biosynthesis